MPPRMYISSPDPDEPFNAEINALFDELKAVLEKHMRRRLNAKLTPQEKILVVADVLQKSAIAATGLAGRSYGRIARICGDISRDDAVNILVNNFAVYFDEGYTEE